MGAADNRGQLDDDRTRIVGQPHAAPDDDPDRTVITGAGKARSAPAVDPDATVIKPRRAAHHASPAPAAPLRPR